MVNIAAMHQRPEERPEHETWAAGLAKALSGGAPAAAYVGFVGEEGDEGCPPRVPACDPGAPRPGEASVRP